MDAFVKCGHAGYGYGYGYGNSKAKMNYHSQNTESVTTVITEINRMTVNEKPSCGAAGAGVQKQAYKEKEVSVEHDQGSSYGGYHGGGAVQKQSSYKEEVYEGTGAAVKKTGYKQEKYGEADGGYGAHYYGGTAGGKKQGYKQEACGETDAGHGAHYGGGAGAVQTYAYDQQAPYGGAIGATAAVQQHGYQKDTYGGAAVKKDSYHQHETYSECDAGYGSHYGGGAGVQTNAYKQQEKYGEADGGYGAYYGGGAGVKKQGYKQEANGETGAGYGAHYGGGAVEQHAYQKHKDAYGYGGGAAKKNSYQHESYGECDAGYGGGAVHQRYGCKQDVYAGKAAGGNPLQYGGVMAGAYGYEAHGKAASKTEFAGGYNQSHNHKACESETESDSDESDCEDPFPPRGYYNQNKQQGGLLSYGAYKPEKHGASNLGGVRRYESYERHEELGGGRRYESYQSTTQEYAGGRYGYGTCPPLNNTHLLSYGA